MTLTIRQVDGWRGTAHFVDVAWRVRETSIDRGATRWVPPLRRVIRDALSPKNPFYQHADRALFVAERGGRAVGRVAAIENRAHNQHHNDRVGFFRLLRRRG